MAETKHTEASLTEAILKTWPNNTIRPRFIVGLQVRDAAGFSAWRHIDAVVLDTWPSKGLILHALEIKTSRSDLRRELQDPAKAKAFENLVDRFSLVAPPGVVDLSILPKHWGLYQPTDDGKLRARRKPLPVRSGEPAAKTINRSFAAAFIRAVVSRNQDTQALLFEYERGRKAGVQDAERRVERAERNTRELQNTIQKFKEASGIEFNEWQAGHIGEAVKLILRGGIDQRLRYSDSIRSVGERLIKLADELDAIKVEFDEGMRDGR